MQVGFLGLLAIVFIILKLTEVIAWSWVWVLAPLWGGFVIGVTIIVLVFLFQQFVEFRIKNKKKV